MASLNRKSVNKAVTHEGGKAITVNLEQQLRRSVLSCFLWEDEFYEEGAKIADRLIEAATKVSPKFLADLTVEARTKYNLRHVPLLLLSVLADTSKGSSLVRETIPKVIQRADELAEFLVVFAEYKKTSTDKIKSILTHGIRKGLAEAFTKFSEYNLAKYNRNNAVKLRDVLFLSHSKPKNPDQEALYKRLIDGNMSTPDTWEVELSAGKDKKETWERLLKEGKLGYLALLRNLRNMEQVSVTSDLVIKAIEERKGGAERVLPFRYVAASRFAPRYEPYLDRALQVCIKELPPLLGTTLVLVDVSGSMDHQLSGKSDMRRIDAAAALASIINGDVRVFTFSNALVEVPPRRGMAGVDAVIKSQQHGGTYLKKALKDLESIKRDRLIVITDEQSHDGVFSPDGLKYMINVASYQNGVGYRDGWTHLDGFSENVIRYIHELEQFD